MSKEDCQFPKRERKHREWSNCQNQGQKENIENCQTVKWKWPRSNRKWLKSGDGDVIFSPAHHPGWAPTSFLRVLIYMQAISYVHWVSCPPFEYSAKRTH